MGEGIAEGEGWAVGSIEDMGEGYGFRKIRKELGVTAFGVNAIVAPPGYVAGYHYHDEQEELYICLSGAMRIEFGDGSSHDLGPGGVARVDPPTTRRISNPGEEDLVLVVVGGKDGYVGRDGRLPEGETSRFGDNPPPG
jgi:mannose-6-phosphate isomerase-like protein (cupin superfamily)